MSKKYYLLPQENVGDLDRQRTGFNSGFDEDDAKEVEVLDIGQAYQEAVKSGYMTITQYLKANKYLIVKIIE